MERVITCFFVDGAFPPFPPFPPFPDYKKGYHHSAKTIPAYHHPFNLPLLQKSRIDKDKYDRSALNLHHEKQGEISHRFLMGQSVDHFDIHWPIKIPSNDCYPIILHEVEMTTKHSSEYSNKQEKHIHITGPLDSLARLEESDAHPAPSRCCPSDSDGSNTTPLHITKTRHTHLWPSCPPQTTSSPSNPSSPALFRRSHSGSH